MSMFNFVPTALCKILVNLFSTKIAYLRYWSRQGSDIGRNANHNDPQVQSGTVYSKSVKEELKW